MRHDPKDLPGEVHVWGDDPLVLMGSAWEKKHSSGKVGVNCQTAVRVQAQGGRKIASGNDFQQAR